MADTAIVDADGTGNLFTTPNGEIGLVNADPALVILIDGSDAATPDLDADMYFQLADAVRYCIPRRDDVASHFRLHDTPLTIMLGLTDDPGPPIRARLKGHGAGSKWPGRLQPLGTRARLLAPRRICVVTRCRSGHPLGTR